MIPIQEIDGTFTSSCFNMHAIRHVFLSKKAVGNRPLFSSHWRSSACRDDRMFDPIWLNQAAIEEALKQTIHTRFFFTNQNHSNKVLVIDQDMLASNDTVPFCDALVTNCRDTVLAIYTADCVPILFCDPVHGVVGVAHGGWRGLQQKIIQNTVAAMQEQGAVEQDIFAAIGPCIHWDSYEVTAELADFFPDDPDCFQMRDGRLFCDLIGIAKKQLLEAGVVMIDNVDIDTYRNQDLFYSYRGALVRDEPLQGVQASAIVLRECD